MDTQTNLKDMPAELATLLTLQDKLFAAKLYQPQTNSFGDLEIQRVNIPDLVKEIMGALRAADVFKARP